MGLIRRRSAVLLTATILAGAAFTIEPAVMRDLTVNAAGGRLSVGAVRTSLIGAALAQSDTVTLDNVVLTLGPVTYKAKRVEFTGVTSSRADIEALFDKASTEPSRRSGMRFSGASRRTWSPPTSRTAASRKC
jgi:hypothetical protein